MLNTLQSTTVVKFSDIKTKAPTGSIIDYVTQKFPSITEVNEVELVKQIRDVPEYYRWTLENLELSHDMFITLCNMSDDNVYHILKNPYITIDLLDRLTSNKSKAIRQMVAGHNIATPEILDKLVDDKYISIKKVVAKHPNTTSEILRKLSVFDSRPLKVMIATHPNTSPEILTELSKHKEWRVRYTVVQNRNTPIDVLEKLTKNDTSYIMKSNQETIKLKKTLVTETEDEKPSNIFVYKPKVTRIGYSGIGVCVIGARTCYDSFNKSPNEFIREYSNNIHNGGIVEELKNVTDDIDLLWKLSWTLQHESILEHSTVTFDMRGVSRGVLQENSRHRIAAHSVKSTRYTMDEILKVFLITYMNKLDPYLFVNYFSQPDKNFLITEIGSELSALELSTIYTKLELIHKAVGNDPYTILSTKYSVGELTVDDTNGVTVDTLEVMLNNISIQKRNNGDSYKNVVGDTWMTDIIFTINLRSLKNFLKLRDSGAAWIQMQTLAKEMIKVLPEEVKRLVIKGYWKPDKK